VPGHDDRVEFILRFVTEGDPRGAQRDAQDVAGAWERLAETAGRLDKSIEELDKKVAQVKPRIDQHKTVLQEAGDAAYHFGMGAQWADIPGTRFVATAGNVVQGLDWIVRGVGELVTKVPPAAAVLVGAGVAVVGLTVALAEATAAAVRLVGAMRDLSAVSGQGLGAVATQYNALASVVGGEGASSLIGGVAATQARLAADPVAMSRILGGAAARQRNPLYYNPVELATGGGPLAAFGVSPFAAGSTIMNPRPLAPEDVALQAALGIAQRRIAGQGFQAAQELQTVGPLLGGVDQLRALAERVEAELRANPATTADELKRRLQEEGAHGFTPTKEDAENLRQYEQASAQLGAAWEALKASVGAGLIPLVAQFTAGLAEGVREVGGFIRWLGDLARQAGIGGGAFKDFAYVLGWLIPQAVRLAVISLTALVLPFVGVHAVLRAVADVLGLFKPASAEAAEGLKGTGDALGGLDQSMKRVDWPGTSGQIKGWGDTVSNAAKVAGDAIDDVARKFTNLQSFCGGLFDYEFKANWSWATTAAASAYDTLLGWSGLKPGVAAGVAFNVIASWVPFLNDLTLFAQVYNILSGVVAQSKTVSVGVQQSSGLSPDLQTIDRWWQQPGHAVNVSSTVLANLDHGATYAGQDAVTFTNTVDNWPANGKTVTTTMQPNVQWGQPSSDRTDARGFYQTFLAWLQQAPIAYPTVSVSAQTQGSGAATGFGAWDALRVLTWLAGVAANPGVALQTALTIGVSIAPGAATSIWNALMDLTGHGNAKVGGSGGGGGGVTAMSVDASSAPGRSAMVAGAMPPAGAGAAAVGGGAASGAVGGSSGGGAPMASAASVASSMVSSAPGLTSNALMAAASAGTGNMVGGVGGGVAAAGGQGGMGAFGPSQAAVGAVTAAGSPPSVGGGGAAMVGGGGGAPVGAVGGGQATRTLSIGPFYIDAMDTADAVGIQKIARAVGDTIVANIRTYSNQGLVP
jgi:hypothetical protein